MHKKFAPVDVLSLAFICLLLMIVLISLPHLPDGAWLIVRFLALATAIIAVALLAARSPASSWLRFIHAFLPVLIVPVLFDSMGDIIPWVRSGTIDDLLIRTDQLLFGGHHPTVLMEQFVHPLLTSMMQYAYISYYPMAAALGVVLWSKKNETAFDEAIFGILLCFYLSYLGYLLFPAVGPRFTLAHLQTRDLAAGPCVKYIQEMLDALENTKTDAFPSGHTAVAMMTLYYSIKYRLRIFSAFLLPAVSGLVLSTVYLRYHYVIDVIAGMSLTLLTIGLAPTVRGWLLSTSGQAGDQLHHSS